MSDVQYARICSLGEIGVIGMLATLRSSTISGVKAIPITVEVDVSHGLPAFDVVGLPSVSVRESRDRVRTAVKNAGFQFPIGRVTVNLAPAHIRKTGTLLDLPIAIGVLAASEQIRLAKWVHRSLLVGELSLDGSLQSVRGALAVASSLREDKVVLIAPALNASEIEAVPGVKYVTAPNLYDMVRLLSSSLKPRIAQGVTVARERPKLSRWAEIRGQDKAKRALKISMAGRHHVMMMGPPGIGKTMLAKGTADLLLPLDPSEVIDVSTVYSVAGKLSPERPIMTRRPFRHPHHTVTTAGMLGGGNVPTVGEVSLAHRGILFLDEFGEFDRRIIEGLREALEDGFVTLSRMYGSVQFPAAFTLIASLNACPCGFLHDTVKACTCRPGEINRYRRRLSGPLMDRIDLFVKMDRIDYDLMVNGKQTIQTNRTSLYDDGYESIVQKLERAVHRQRKRFQSHRTNSQMTPNELNEFARLDNASETFLLRAAKKFMMSTRAVHRTLKVARTIADMEGSDDIVINHLSEALSFRSESVLDI